MSKLDEIASDVPSPDPTKRTTLVYNPLTGLRENVEQVSLDLTGASAGDVLALDDITSATKTLKKVATVPTEASANATEEGRVFVGNGLKMEDLPTSQVILADVAPTTLDGYEGAFWYDRTAKLMYGPKGYTASGQWGTGRMPVPSVVTPPSEWFSAKFVDVSALPITSPVQSPVETPLILTVEDIQSIGTWTADATGITVPEDGDYRISVDVETTNNAGVEAICVGVLLVNGVAPTYGGRGFIDRTESSRYPLQSFTTRLSLTAGDVVALEVYCTAAHYGINGTNSGILIERVT